MSKKQDDTLFSALLGALFAIPFLALLFLMTCPFYFFKGHLSRKFHLERAALYWPIAKWPLLALKWISAIGFAYSLLCVVFHFYGKQAPSAHGFSLPLYLATSLLCSLVFNLVSWTAELFDSPEFQKKLAGVKAERFVKNLIESHRHRYPEAQTMHGALFVFNPGTDNEYSLEIDHVLITPKNIFVIETKYKSGTVHVDPSADMWKVTSEHGHTHMRNALAQVKNAARIIEKQLKLSAPPIPVVVIKGNGLTLIDAPTNVVCSQDLVRVIDAFELNRENNVHNSAAIMEQLLRHRSSDMAALERHMKRATIASESDQISRIVNSASLH
jgi:hypothetical protein